MPRPIIMDCDPGADDAVALLIALASPEEFIIQGITTVAGNASLDHIHRNARRICELGGRPDLPVFSGCKRPLVRLSLGAEECHGADGLAGCSLPAPAMPLQEKHAVNFIIETLLTTKEKVTLFFTGPLTNLATALIMEPQILEQIEEIILMGGSFSFGNCTAAAEFNMYFDPHAAHVVFSSGAKITMIGLDVTHKLLTSPARLQALRSLENQVGHEVANILEQGIEFDTTQWELSGRAFHDVCVPLYALRPDLFRGRPARVDIDIFSELSMGRTVVGWYQTHCQSPNAYVLTDIDADGVFNVMLERLSRYRD